MNPTPKTTARIQAQYLRDSEKAVLAEFAVFPEVVELVGTIASLRQNIYAASRALSGLDPCAGLATPPVVVVEEPATTTSTGAAHTFTAAPAPKPDPVEEQGAPPARWNPHRPDGKPVAWWQAEKVRPVIEKRGRITVVEMEKLASVPGLNPGNHNRHGLAHMLGLQRRRDVWYPTILPLPQPWPTPAPRGWLEPYIVQEWRRSGKPRTWDIAQVRRDALLAGVTDGGFYGALGRLGFEKVFGTAMLVSGGPAS